MCFCWLLYAALRRFHVYDNDWSKRNMAVGYKKKYYKINLLKFCTNGFVKPTNIIYSVQIVFQD